MFNRTNGLEVEAVDEYQKGKEDKETIKLLPNGQIFILHTNRPDSRESGEYNSICEELLRRTKQKSAKQTLRVFNSEYSRGRNAKPELFLYRSAEEHLRRYGYNYFDAKYWATLISHGDYRADKCFPHSFFLSLAAHIQFPKPFQYQIRVPKYVEYIDPQFAAKNLPVPDLLPVKVGAALPIIGWLDDYGDSIRNEVTLLRNTSGSVAPGKLSIPGGKTDDLLEITAWEEFMEEVQGLVHPFTGNPVSYNQSPHRVCYQSIVDQVIVLPNGKPRRYQADVFKFDIPLNTITFLNTDYNDYSKMMHGADGDGNGVWNIETMEYVQRSLRKNPNTLSPLAQCTFQDYFDN